jgi:hypothetical protein
MKENVLFIWWLTSVILFGGGGERINLKDNLKDNFATNLKKESNPRKFKSHDRQCYMPNIHAKLS